MSSPWRRLSYRELQKIDVNGDVLDLGGSRKSGYHELLGGAHNITVVNIADDVGSDLSFDVEKTFPIEDKSYDVVLAINLLEHLYDGDNFFSETKRVLKKSGKVVIVVPFLMFYHPSPKDFVRYTEDALKKKLEEHGFKNISVTSVGHGPGAVYTQMMGGVRGGRYLRPFVTPFLQLSDFVLSLLMDKSEMKKRFPLGYVVTANI